MPKITKKTNSERRYKALLEFAYENIIVYDKDGVIVEASPKIKNVVGYTAKDLIGKKGRNFVHPEDAAAMRDSFKNLQLKKGRSVTLIFRTRHKKGHYFWTESHLTNCLHHPNIKGVISNFKDIHARTIAEEKLAETQHVLETINTNLSEGIFMSVLGKKVIYANDAFAKLFGFSSSKDLLKVRSKNLFANKKSYNEVVDALNQSGRVRNVEILFEKKDGTNFWGKLNARKVAFLQNENCAIGSVRDITQQKRIKRELVSSHRFLQNVINTVAAPIFVKDSMHRWILFNDEFVRGFDDVKRAAIKNKTDHDFMSKKLADQIWKDDNEILRTGHTMLKQEILPGKKGATKVVLTTKSRFIDGSGEKFIIGFMMDITEQKRFENIIKATGARLRSVIESTKDEILALDRNFHYTMFNQAHFTTMKNMTGHDIKVGDNILPILPEELAKRARKEVKRAFKGDAFDAEVIMPNKKIIRASFNPIRDEKNAVTGVAIFAEDITLRKHTEQRLKAMNDELTEQNWKLATQEEDLKTAFDQLSERNFELDQLMYKTSHDLRSPLSSILGLVNLALVDKEPVRLAEYLSKIEGRIKKLDEFISSMINYARVSRGDIVTNTVNLEEIAWSAVRELEYLENFKNVHTTVELVQQKDVTFRNDLFRIKIIFSNIISNAYKYYNPDVSSFLNIKIQVTPPSASIEFRDNGIGIKDEHMDKIFNMFFRATDRSQGSGLGMYIVKQAVERLDGTVSIKSAFGSGTELKITIPNL